MTSSSNNYFTRSLPTRGPLDHPKPQLRGILREQKRDRRTSAPVPGPSVSYSSDESSAKRYSLPVQPVVLRAGRVESRDRCASSGSMQLPEAEMGINSYERDRAARASGKAPSPLLALDMLPHSENNGVGAEPIEPIAHRVGAPYGNVPLRMPKSHPQYFLRRLEPLVRSMKMRMADQIDVEDVVEMHDQDVKMREQRDNPKGNELDKRVPQHVFGMSLGDVWMYASTTAILGNHRHDLPIVVFACVEELYRTGIYQHHLFRALPNRERHMELIRQFDQQPKPVGYAKARADFNVSLRAESMPDICAVLSSYLSALPETVLPMQFHGAFWIWCVKPSVLRDDRRRKYEEWEDEEARERKWAALAKKPIKGKFVRGSPPPAPFTEEETYQMETDQIAIAQLLLHLLPSPNFSLIIYLCAFFTQIPLCPDNGLTLGDVAQIFSEALFGGVKWESFRMMEWLLTRWWRISEGLIEQLEEDNSQKRETHHALYDEDTQRDNSHRKSQIIPRAALSSGEVKSRDHRRDTSPLAAEHSACDERSASDEGSAFGEHSVYDEGSSCGQSSVQESSHGSSSSSGKHGRLSPAYEGTHQASTQTSVDDMAKNKVVSSEKNPETKAQNGDLSYLWDRTFTGRMESNVFSDTASAYSTTTAAECRIQDEASKLRDVVRVLTAQLAATQDDKRKRDEELESVEVDAETLRRQLEEVSDERDHALRLVEGIRNLLGSM